MSTNKPRITDGFCYGTGDSGYSLLMDSTRLRKDNPAANIYGAIEHLANEIDELAEYESTIQDSSLLKTLIWFRDNTYSMSAFCFMKANTQDHVFPATILDYMDGRIQVLSDAIGEAPDFIARNSGYLRVLDRIRVYIRDVERAYVTWRWDDKVVSKLLDTLKDDAPKAQEMLFNIERMGAVLNRASAWIWWEIRNEKRLATLLPAPSRIKEVEEEYWQGRVMPFAM